MKFPVFSQLAGNWPSETSSLVTASSSGESCANLTFADESAHVASSSRRSSSGETQEVKASADVLDASRLTLNLGCS